MTFGEALKAARASLGLSQQALADQTGLHRNHICKLEADQRDPTLGTIRKLADVLGRKWATSLFA